MFLIFNQFATWEHTKADTLLGALLFGLSVLSYVILPGNHLLS